MQLIFEIGLSGPRLKFPFSLGFSLGNFFAGADLSFFRAFIGALMSIAGRYRFSALGAARPSTASRRSAHAAASSSDNRGLVRMNVDNLAGQVAGGELIVRDKKDVGP